MATAQASRTLADDLADDFRHFAGETDGPELTVFLRDWWRTVGPEPRPGQARGAAIAKAGGRVAFTVKTNIDGILITREILATVGDGPTFPTFDVLPQGASLAEVPRASAFHEDGTPINT